MRRLLSTLFVLVAAAVAFALPNGELWKDDRGVHVNAHGGGVIWHGGRYWWYGEHKVGGDAGNRAHGTAVHVYSSENLNDWKDEGAALTCSSDPASDIADGAVIERPKVLFCAKTGKFVMRFHLELKGQGYRAARTGVAVSDTPQGPFRFLRSSRLNAGRWPQDKPDAAANEAAWKKLFSGPVKFNLPGNDNPASRACELWLRDYEGGQMTRDQTLFVDDDGTAYQISASEENATLQIAELTDDYLGTTGRFWRMAERTWTEAPAVCKRDGWYYLVGSGCTGWAPNAARIFRARSLKGPWERLGNPCRGTNPASGLGPDLTWGGQSTFILKVQGRDQYLAMFDIWRPKNAIDGRYVWLPLDFSTGVPTIPWRASWDDPSPDVRVQPVAGDATDAVQGAIDRVFRSGGGKVVLGKGTWPVKALRVRSRVTLYLEAGATLQGSRNIDDYFILDDDKVEPVPREWITHEAWERAQSCSKDNFTRYPASRWNNGLVRLLGATDAAIVGEKGGVIDGMNPYDEIGEEFYRGPQGVSAINCTNLVLKGYTIRNTGNWAHRIADTQGLLVEEVACEAGHDGVHINGVDHARISRCDCRTGDDCIAGFDNSDVVVEDCFLNTACSGFRFAGTDILIRRCRLQGPGEYGFRGSLSKEDKIAGAPSGKAPRSNMLSFFTYYSDGTHPVRRNAGRIRIVDCTSDDTDRLLHYNYGNEQWQRGKPMTDISFENVKATRIKMPVSAWGDRDVPVRLAFRNCEIGFSKPQPEFIRGSFIGGVELENVKVEGVDGPLVRLWNADALKPEVKASNLSGVSSDVVPATAPWSVRGI